MKIRIKVCFHDVQSLAGAHKLAPFVCGKISDAIEAVTSGDAGVTIFYEPPQEGDVQYEGTFVVSTDAADFKE